MLKHVGEQSQQAVMLHTVLDLLVYVRHTCCYTVRSSLPLLSHFYDNVPCLQQNFRCTSEEKVTCTSGETHVYKRVVLLYIIHTYVTVYVYTLAEPALQECAFCCTSDATFARERPPRSLDTLCHKKKHLFEDAGVSGKRIASSGAKCEAMFWHPHPTTGEYQGRKIAPASSVNLASSVQT